MCLPFPHAASPVCDKIARARSKPGKGKLVRGTSLVRPWRRVLNAVRWRMGLTVIAEELGALNDECISSFYGSRITRTDFLSNPGHYEKPRADWMVAGVSGGSLLEVGCGDGGMTALLSPKVDHIIALDVSAPSLLVLRDRGLKNVQTVVGLVETIRFDERFDWIVMSEVLEHVRRPALVLNRCFDWLAPGGMLLLTTPNGRWESNEHLHEFSLDSFTRLLVQSRAETLSSGFLRDALNRRRWLCGKITKSTSPAAPDDFNSSRARASMRRRAR